MEERQRECLSEADIVESYRWFDRTKTNQSSWVRNALLHLGHLLVILGHQLEDGAINMTATPTKQLKNM